jgi:hypothetical protein
MPSFALATTGHGPGNGSMFCQLHVSEVRR